MSFLSHTSGYTEMIQKMQRSREKENMHSRCVHMCKEGNCDTFKPCVKGVQLHNCLEVGIHFPHQRMPYMNKQHTWLLECDFETNLYDKIQAMFYEVYRDIPFPFKSIITHLVQKYQRMLNATNKEKYSTLTVLKLTKVA